MPVVVSSAAQLTATAANDSPLMVICDGADTACPAESLDAVAYTIGDRVQITVRTPRMPLVTGKTTTA